MGPGRSPVPIAGFGRLSGEGEGRALHSSHEPIISGSGRPLRNQSNTPGGVRESN